MRTGIAATSRLLAPLIALVLALFATQAAAVDLPVLNTGFEYVTTTSGNTVLNKWVTGDNGADQALGSVYSTTAISHSGARAMVMYPSPTLGHVSVSQLLNAGQVIGETLTISGWYLKSHAISDDGDNLKLRAKFCYAEGGGSDTGECGAYSVKGRASGFWNETNCRSSDLSGWTGATSWVPFSFSCTAPIGGTTNLDLAQVWLPVVVIETTGTAKAGHVILVDDISVSASDLAEPAHVPQAVSATLGVIPDEAAFIGISSRDPDDGDEGFRTRDVYATQLDGTEAVRVTDTTHGGYLNTAVNPVNHHLIAVERITEDWNHDEAHDFYDPPHSVWILDTTPGNQREWQLTPTYQNAGLASVEWTPDGEWVFFGMTQGRHWWVYRAKATPGVTFSPVRLTNVAATDAADAAGVCNETDLSVSNSGDWAAGRRALEAVDGSCIAQSSIFKVRVANDQGYVSAQTPVVVWTPDHAGYDPANGLPFYGDLLPIGGYDPEFSDDDSQFVIEWNNDETVGVNDGGLDIARLDNCDVPGKSACPTTGNPTLLIDDASWTDLDNYDWRLATDWHWNPSQPGDHGFVSAVLAEDGEYTYVGLNRYDASASTPGTANLVNVEASLYSAPNEDDGTQYDKLITGGRHNPGYTNSCSKGFANASNAFKEDDTFADDVSGSESNVGDCQSFSYYGFPIPSGAVIDGIEVRLQWKSESTGGGPRLKANLTWNHGTTGTWTAAKTSSTLAAGNTEQRDTLGSPTDTWGRSWTVSELQNTDFGVLVTTDCSTAGTCAASPYRDWWIDWVGVRVYWHL